MLHFSQCVKTHSSGGGVGVLCDVTKKKIADTNNLIELIVKERIEHIFVNRIKD